MKKKLLSFVLALTLVFSMLPMSAFAEEVETPSAVAGTEANGTSAIAANPESGSAPEASPTPEASPSPEASPEPDATPAPEASPAPEVMEAEASDWASLKAAVENSSVNRIKISADIEMEEALTLTRSIEFISASETEGHILYSANGYRHFVITSSATTELVTMKFSGLTLDGKNSSGGIEQQNKNPVIIDGVSINNFCCYEVVNDEKSQKEYAIEGKNLSVKNSSISNCYGGGILINGIGIGFEFEISHTTVEGKMENGKYVRTSVGVSLSGEGKISDSTIRGFAQGLVPDTYGNGGTVSNCEIRDNYSGVYLRQDYNGAGHVSFLKCNIHHNSTGISMNLVDYGNAFRTYLSESHVSNNSGNGIYSYGGIVSLYKSEVANNGANGLKTWFSVVSLTESQIYNNTERGVDNVYAKETTIAASSIYANGSLGVGIECRRPQGATGGTDITNSNFYDNKGRGISVLADRTYISVSTCDIYRNEGEGVALSWMGTKSTRKIEGCKIHDNSGCGIYLLCSEDHSVKITDNEIYANKANDSGGGIYIRGTQNGSIEIENNDIYANEAKKGAGIYICDTSADNAVAIRKCQLHDNVADYYGGAIGISDPKHISTDAETSFSGNEARDVAIPPENALEMYPNLQFSSVSIGSHPLNNYDISYSNGEEVHYITEVPDTNWDSTVDYKTEFEALGLPKQIEVRTDSFSKAAMDVSWSNYKPTMIGEQHLVGSIILTELIENPYNLQIEATITVRDPNTIKTFTGSGCQYIMPNASEDEMDGLLAFGDYLPKTSKVEMGDGTIREVPIKWEDHYHSGKSEFYGDRVVDNCYYFEGQIDFSSIPNLTERPEEKVRFEFLQAWANASYDILSVPATPAIRVDTNITKAQLGELINKQFPKARVLLPSQNSNFHKLLNVTWKTDELDFDGTKPGRYTVYGEIELESIGSIPITNPNKLQAELQVFVIEGSIVSVEPVNKISVKWGTNSEELLETLNTECSTVSVTLNNGTNVDRSVVWDISTSIPHYSGKYEGSYIICGNIDLNERNPVSNPQEYSVTVEVRVNPRIFYITAVDEIPMSVEQYTNLKPLDKNYQLSGSPSLANPPETVTVHLDNKSTASLPVNWQVEEFDPAKVTQEGEASQRVTGEIQLPEDGSIINPQNIQAELDITVTPTTLKVAQASPKKISIEVYKGTTLEELNQQLEAEGKNEISILATNPKNAVRRTFCNVFLEENVNPDWETQKEQPGTYTLTASWPENIQPRSAKIPGPITINVTVLEPLEITGTKLAKADMYQGVDPENATNIPAQVIAILEDGSEVNIDVQWDWSFYNKDNLSNPPVIGELVNLPHKAKQPAGEKITGTMSVQMIPVAYTIQSIASSPFSAKAGLTLEEITALAGKEGSEIPAFIQTLQLSGTAEDGEIFTINRTVPFVLTSGSNPEFSPTEVKMYVLTGDMVLPENISTESFPNYNQIKLTTQPVEIVRLETVSVIDREGTEFVELSNVPETVLAVLDVEGPDGVAKTASLAVDWGEGAGFTPFPEGLTEDTPITMTVEGSLVELPSYIQPTDLVPTLSVTLGREFDILSISPVRIPETGTLDVNLGTDFSAIDGLLDHNVELRLLCTNGEERTQKVSFELLGEEEQEYDAMTQDTYHLTTQLLTGSNVKNPKNLSVEVVVRTMKYTIVEAYAIDDIFMNVGENVQDYLPKTAPALRSDDTLEEVPTVWDLSAFDNSAGAFNVVEGTFTLPVHLENPDGCQPVAFVFVDDPDSQILSMTQITNEDKKASLFTARREKETSGYIKHKYKVERLYKDGAIKEQVMTFYTKAS